MSINPTVHVANPSDFLSDPHRLFYETWSFFFSYDEALTEEKTVWKKLFQQLKGVKQYILLA